MNSEIIAMSKEALSMFTFFSNRADHPFYRYQLLGWHTAGVSYTRKNSIYSELS